MDSDAPTGSPARPSPAAGATDATIGVPPEELETARPAARPAARPPGQSSWAGPVIAVVVFVGVVLAVVAIGLMPEKTVDYEDTVRLHSREMLTVRFVGERGMLEILNEGPLPVTVSSPVGGAPIAAPIELQPGEYVRRDVRDVGAIDVVNLGETVTTIRWRGGGPEPAYINADPPKPMP